MFAVHRLVRVPGWGLFMLCAMGESHDRWIVGCMTGTSLDGLDAALVRIAGKGLAMQANYVGMLSEPLGGLGQRLLSLARGEPSPAIAFLRAGRELGQVHAKVVTALCRRHLPKGAAVEFVAAHGQTIWHAPNEHLSWQLLDPWPMVRRLKVPVVYDLRQADLISEGQGAPITPIADWVLFRHATRRRYVVNLGGICNLTILPGGAEAGQVLGQDVAPCNLLLNGLVRRLFENLAIDDRGQIASRGTLDGFVYDALLQRGLVHVEAGKSLGRENLDAAFFDWLLHRKPSRCRSEDVLASAADAIARTIGLATAAATSGDVILAGGGVHHDFLVDRIGKYVAGRHRVMTSEELGMPTQAREAAAFAILGALSADGVPIGVQRITGSRGAGRAGCWVYP